MYILLLGPLFIELPTDPRRRPLHEPSGALVFPMVSSVLSLVEFMLANFSRESAGVFSILSSTMQRYSVCDNDTGRVDFKILLGGVTGALECASSGGSNLECVSEKFSRGWIKPMSYLLAGGRAGPIS